FDMHGNVWEWTQDPAFEPLSPVNGRVSRNLLGGAYYVDPAIIRRGSERNHYLPSERITNIGFRPAKTLWPDRPNNY
ncbi:MAG: SUMF1/EgtB/PvdO family nonheme iron enzyme, partial [Planctomycetaceae bacterium]|nr:SUMF1/EgtB/PvdO family nonheme iron enzyme [Planctomycetaceae bacterium]